MSYLEDHKATETSHETGHVMPSIPAPQPGFRAGHAKGILLDGVFTPSAEAKILSKAAHFNEPYTPVTVRFSSSTGNHDIADSDPHGNPPHSIDGTPGSNGEEAFVAASGAETLIRYRIEPVAGAEDISPEEAAASGSDYLFGEIPGLLDKGPIEFDLTVQVAEEGDVTNDSFVKWPETRKVVTLGRISLEKVSEDNAARQKYMIFDLVPKVDGVELSDDSLPQYRAGIYLCQRSTA
ncbi:heme-dependent catalase [Thozetella sp. PMI_491]|nr:heme-dependent catalase [Thozetella sp. PMI_491]